MMHAERSRGIVGLLFILVGIILFTMNMGWLEYNTNLLWGIGFIVFGIAMIVRFRRVDPRISLLLIGVVLVVIGSTILLNAFHIVSEDFIGAAFLWAVGAVFLSVHLRGTQFWWAIIPGGILVVVGCLVFFGSSGILNYDYLPFLFFSGLSLVFWYLRLYRHPDVNLRWAVFPAAILSVIAIILLMDMVSIDVWKWVFPLGLIAVGGIIIWRNVRAGRSEISVKNK